MQAHNICPFVTGLVLLCLTWRMFPRVHLCCSRCQNLCPLKKKVVCLFGCASQDLHCSVWDLVPCPRVEPGPLAFRAQSLKPQGHWGRANVPFKLNNIPLCVLTAFCFSIHTLVDAGVVSSIWLS